MKIFNNKSVAFLLAVLLLFGQVGFTCVADNVGFQILKVASLRDTANESQSSSQEASSSSSSEVSSSSSEVSSSSEASSSSEVSSSSSEVSSSEVSSSTECTCNPALAQDAAGHDFSCPCFVCDCPTDSEGSKIHQPGCAAYVMSDSLKELCNLVIELPSADDVGESNVDDVMQQVNRISELYYLLSDFDASIFDHSEYLTKLLAVNDAACALKNQEEKPENESSQAASSQVIEPVLLQPAAVVNTAPITTYSALIEALDSAADGDTLYIKTNLTDSLLETIEFNCQGRVTIELRDNIALGLSDVPVFNVNSGTLVINGGKVTSGADGYTINLLGGELMLENCAVTNTKEGAGAISAAPILPQSYIAVFGDSESSTTTATEYSFDAKHGYVAIFGASDVSPQLSVSIGDWEYAQSENLPALTNNGTDVTQNALFTYSDDQNGGYSLRDSFFADKKSSAGFIKAGTYYVKADYIDSAEKALGSSVASFKVLPKEVSAGKGTLAVSDNAYDGEKLLAILTGEGSVTNSVLGDDVSLVLDSAYFSDQTVGREVEINVSATALAGADSANYRLTNSAITGIYGTIPMRLGTQNPSYPSALSALADVHIITNLTPTLAEAETVLPDCWSFIGNGAEKITANASGDTQNFSLKYTSLDSGYDDVILPSQPLKISTVSLSANDDFESRTAAKGEALILTGASVAVVGAPLADSGYGSYKSMEWFSSNADIAEITAGTVNEATASVSINGRARGLALIKLCYKSPDAAIGDFLVQITDSNSSTANSISQLSAMADYLQKIIGSLPTADGIAAVNAVADGFRALSDSQKAQLSEKDILIINTLLETVNNFHPSVVDSSESAAVTLISKEINGIALASGVSSGDVKVKVTYNTVDSGELMKISLALEVDGEVQQLKTPLFFTLELPESITTHNLVITHIKNDNSKSNVSYTVSSGNKVSFKLDSFSSLVFTKKSSSGGSSGGGSHSNTSYRDGENAFWQQVEDAVIAASSGETLRVNAKYYDNMPVDIITALKGKDVTLIIAWNGGEPIVMNGKTLNLVPEASRIYYPLALLSELLKNIPIAPSYDITASEPADNQQYPESQVPSEQSSSQEPQKSSSVSTALENPSDIIEEPAQSTADITSAFGNTKLIVAACAVLLVLLIVVMLLVLSNAKSKRDKTEKYSDPQQK